MKTPIIILPLILAVAISASGAPGSTGTGAPAVNGSAPGTTPGLNRPNTQNPSNPNAPQQPGTTPQQPGSVPQQPGNTSKNNVGNGTFVNGMPGNNVGNGTFIQSGGPAQPGSPVAGGQNIASNNINGQNVNGQNTTGQNTNQSGASGTPQQTNQQAWMTNRPPLQTNSGNPQLEMTNNPSIPMSNSNTPPQ